MHIIQKKWEFLNSTLDSVPKQATGLYSFGLATLAARPIRSLRSNARLLSLNWHTAKSKAYRLTKNTKLLAFFPALLPEFAPLSEDDAVCLDFSDFGCGLQVLMFAQQTRRGRARPLYFEVLKYPIQKDSPNTFVIQAIEHFVKRVGTKPCLVMDRGFACPSIIRFLEDNQYLFIVRLKGGKHLLARNGRLVAARDMKRKDALVSAYGKNLRLVTSEHAAGAKEPWYLLTNDMAASREALIGRYYHRFEIEEFFRDAKRLLGLEWISCKTGQSLAILLWFVLLGIWCLEHLEALLREHEKDMRETMELSSVRYVFERLEAEAFALSEGRFFSQLAL